MRPTFVTLLLTLAAGACGGRGPQDTSATTPTGVTTPLTTPPTTPTPTTLTTPTTSPIDERAAFEQAGFVVQDGVFLFSTMEGCCSEDAYCWGNNPSTPYGTPALPPAPGEAPETSDLLEDFGPLPDPNLSRTFHLRADEAFVLLGQMPPDARYFSYRSYLAFSGSLDKVVIGSLGASLNQLVVAEDRGVTEEEVWTTPLAVISSADAEVEARVRDALLAAGWDAAHLHTDRIPAEVAQLGYGASDDTFFALMRVAVYDDPAGGEAWQAAPGYAVYRLSGEPATAPTVPHPLDELPARGTGLDEEAWRSALDELEVAALAAYPGYAVTQLAVVPYWNETYECFSLPGSCDGEIRDRMSAITLPFTLGEDEAVVVVGVNHERTGKAAYSSFALQTMAAQRGVDAVESDEMVGSVDGLLPVHPSKDDLYAWVVARDCDQHTVVPCLEMPATCPGGPVEEKLKITIRAYLERATGAAPLPEELVGDRVFLLTPAATP